MFRCDCWAFAFVDILLSKYPAMIIDKTYPSKCSMSELVSNVLADNLCKLKLMPVANADLPNICEKARTNICLILL